MKHSIPTALAFACVFALLLTASGCGFDPWPEPDPDTNSGDDFGEGGVGDEDDDQAADDDTNDTGEDDDEEGGGDGSLADATSIFCSAPNTDGIVTVVGIPGAVQDGDVVLVSGENNQSQSFVVSENGSFAGRIEAQSGETLSVQVLGEEVESAPVSVASGVLEWGNVGDSIVGPGTGAGGPSDASDAISIQGEGDALQVGLVVIAGNVDLSVGESAAVTCDAVCQFELVIQGGAGDEIDLFLVWDGENSGVTDSQTEVVPEY